MTNNPIRLLAGVSGVLHLQQAIRLIVSGGAIKFGIVIRVEVQSKRGTLVGGMVCLICTAH